jgi:hypothetical protein
MKKSLEDLSGKQIKTSKEGARDPVAQQQPKMLQPSGWSRQALTKPA